MNRNGINMARVKKQNRSLVLRYMNSHSNASRKEIAEATGLTPAAVTQICNDFLDMGLIKECGTDDDEAKGAGRRKVKVQINRDYAYIIGINIELENTYVVITDLSGNVYSSSRLNTSEAKDIDAFIDRIAQSIDAAFKLNPDMKEKVIGGCVSIVGKVDRERGVSLHAYGIWDEEVSLCEMLEQRLGFTFIIENNMDAFANAEIIYGTGSIYDNVLVIKWAPGVGCSIIIDNKIYEGRNGRSAELGHFIVEKNGKKCFCGRKGCLETKISVRAMEEKKRFDVENFADVYEDFDDEIDLFARTLVNTMSILEPNRVVLSGKLFADKNVRERFVEHCMSYDSRYNEKRILHSSLAYRENYIGPIATYIERELF